MTDWKRHHANESEKALEHDLVSYAMDELAGNLGVKGEALPEYGIRKVASHAAQVARAQALGFDPELLRLSNDEADEQVLKLARMAAEAGKPVWLIEANQEGEDG